MNVDEVWDGFFCLFLIVVQTQNCSLTKGHTCNLKN